MKYLGCSYYPENWGVERLRTDAKLMRAAGINAIRIGEFAWSRLEPSEGLFTLDWLRETISVMAEYDISVLMCTPTAAALAMSARDERPHMGRGGVNEFVKRANCKSPNGRVAAADGHERPPRVKHRR